MTRKMKDSGVEWIGKIPEDWKTTKLLFALERPITDGPHETPSYVDEGVPFITINNIDDAGNIDKENANKISHEDAATYNKKAKMKVGDLLFSKSATIGRIAEVDKLDFMVWSPFAILSPNIKVLDNQFLKLLLSLPGYVDHLIGLGSVNTQVNIGMRDMEKSIIPLPNTEHQIKISKFLVEKTKKVDCIRSLLIKEIQTLEDYKKSVITEAVTKGLDKNAEMKDSGIEWIGEIPRHWEVIRIKNAALLKARIGWQGLRSDEFLDDINLPYLVTGTDFKDGFVDWENCVRISEQRFEMDKNIQIKENDLLITKDGTIGKLAISKNCPRKASLNSGVFVIRNQGPYKYFDKYMYYLLQSEQFLLWFELNDAGNSTIRHLYQKDFYNFSFTYPNVKEQEQIALYLDKKTKATDNAIVVKQKQLEVLEEYKKSIIYEYVTGKKEVQ